MNLSTRFALLAGLVVGLAALPPSLAARAPSELLGLQQTTTNGTGQGARTQAQQNQQGATATTQNKLTGAPPKAVPAEEKAYKAFYDVVGDPKSEIALGEDFVKKYPNSRYLGSVYSRLTSAYEATGNTDKMLDVGQKALTINPNNVDVLSMLAYMIPRRYNPNELGAEDQLSQAEQYAKHALALLPTLQKPANLTDEQFAAAKAGEAASCHSGLGLVYFYQHNIPGMVSEMELAVKNDPKQDMTNVFLLGFAYAEAGRWNDALTPLEQCSSAQSPVTDRCKTLLAVVKKHAAAQPKPKPKQ